MGKTKTAFVGGVTEEALSSEDKYKLKQQKRAEAEAKQKVQADGGKKKDKAQVAGLGLKGGERIKVIGAELPAEEVVVEDTVTTEAENKKQKKIRVRGAKYKAAKAKIDSGKLYSTADAIKLAKETNISKFDGTLEMHLVVKKTGVNVNVTLPNSFGKQRAVEVADDKTIEKLKKGKIDFDVLLATADMMPKLVPFARLLGPKGMMPNPKNGTLIKNTKAISEFSADAKTIKTEKDAPIIHTTFGKESMDDKKLIENANVILETLGPKTIVKAYFKASMSPSIKVKI
ncbi:MAG TPA: hypothetical protein VI819_00070 [Patescibacteria group bacterium]|nr:hypothetical protein [Patescibacteria group bacterium]